MQTTAGGEIAAGFFQEAQKPETSAFEDDEASR